MYFIIILNVLLGVLITSAFYPIVGIIVLIFCVLMLTIGYNNTIGESFIRTQMKYWGNDINEIVFSKKKAAFVSRMFDTFFKNWCCNCHLCRNKCCYSCCILYTPCFRLFI